MKVLLGVFIAMVSIIGPGEIARINTLKAEARTAYKAGDFKTAIDKYKYLIDSLGVKEDEVMMNLSNAYFRSLDTANAFTAYQPLTQSNDTKIKSLANMQLGVLANRQGKFENALNYFKQALKVAPDNEDARYNYEMVKKKLEEKKKEEQKKQDQNKDNKDQKKDQKDQKDKKDQQNKDQKDQKDKKDQKDQKDKDKKDQQNKDQKDQKDQKDKKEKEDKEKKDKEKQDKEKQDPSKDDKNKEKKDIPPSVSEKLKDMQMSEEKAKMILEAMKNQEIQYLQQNKRKATKPKDHAKPDW